MRIHFISEAVTKAKEKGSQEGEDLAASVVLLVVSY